MKMVKQSGILFFPRPVRQKVPGTLLSIWVMAVLFASGLSGQEARTRVELLFENQSAVPGTTVTAAIRLTMPDHWHTYWKNPGQAGMVTEIKWELPEWLSAGDVQWPVPERFGEGEFTTYGYSDSVSLLVPLNVGGDAPEGSHSVNAVVTWLECDELCVPGEASVSSELQIVSEAAGDTPTTPFFDALRERLPRPGDGLETAFKWTTISGNSRSFLISASLPEGTTADLSPDFFPDPYPDLDLSLEHEKRVLVGDRLLISGNAILYDGPWPDSIRGLVILEKTESRLGYAVRPVAGEIAATLAEGTPVESAGGSFGKSTSGIISSWTSGLGSEPAGSAGDGSSVIGSIGSLMPQSGSVSAAVDSSPENTFGSQINVPKAQVEEGSFQQSEGAMAASTDQTPSGADAAGANEESDGSASPSTAINYPLAFLLALVGGFILNFMPCVLPVVFLKIMGFVKLREESPATIRSYGIFYLLGVLACYLLLALILIGLRASGREMGFGFQFTSPYFVMGLTLLTALIALNLFGVFEVLVSGRATTAATRLSSKSGNAGAFWGGCFTTLLGTPCMAPGLAAAAGVALSSQTSPAIMILLFLTMGVGLALPYVLASFIPGFIRILPKPGLWMHHFKVIMGFPMAAASLWLLTLNDIHYGKAGIFWIGMFLVAISLIAWIYGSFIQKATRGHGLAWFFIVIGLVSSYFFILESRLDWRNPSAVAEEAPAPAMVSGASFRELLEKSDLPPQLSADPEVQKVLGILSGTWEDQNEEIALTWKPWSPEAVAAARSEGRPVFVDFTASWCVNCKENKRRAIDIPQTMDRFREVNAVLLRGDYTRQPPEITAVLREFNVGGVPLNLIYPPDSSKDPIVLPTYLTPASIQEALDRAVPGSGSDMAKAGGNG